MENTVSILIADDHPLIIDSLVKILQKDLNYTLAGIAQDGLRAWEIFSEKQPDLALLDIDMTGIDGIQLTEKIKSCKKETKVILFTSHKEPWILVRAQKANPDGILLKTQSINSIIHEIKRIVRGEIVFNKEIFQIISGCGIDNSPVTSLSKREIQILKLISEGLTTTDISKKIYLSVNTIETYRKNLLFKFEVTNVALLIKRATDMGFFR